MNHKIHNYKYPHIIYPMSVTALSQTSMSYSSYYPLHSPVSPHALTRDANLVLSDWQNGSSEEGASLPFTMSWIFVWYLKNDSIDTDAGTKMHQKYKCFTLLKDVHLHCISMLYIYSMHACSLYSIQSLCFIVFDRLGGSTIISCDQYSHDNHLQFTWTAQWM